MAPKSSKKRPARSPVRRATPKRSGAARKRAARPKAGARRTATSGRPAKTRRAAKPRPPRKATRPARKQAAPAPARPAAKRPESAAPRRSPLRALAPKLPHPAKPATLERERRRLPEEERLTPKVAGDDRMLASARSGHHELAHELSLHTETSPKLTAGDVDARWQDAYSVGDEAPGGDNPTPAQSRVDDIGKALGINYRDDEELQGGDEVVERDRHRWELDPASADDWPEGHEK